MLLVPSFWALFHQPSILSDICTFSYSLLPLSDNHDNRCMGQCFHALQGANTPFIMKSRGLSRAVPMSEMLERNPQIKHLMEAGELVPDVSHPLHTLLQYFLRSSIFVLASGMKLVQCCLQTLHSAEPMQSCLYMTKDYQSTASFGRMCYSCMAASIEQLDWPELPVPADHGWQCLA